MKWVLNVQNVVYVALLPFWQKVNISFSRRSFALWGAVLVSRGIYYFRWVEDLAASVLKRESLPYSGWRSRSFWFAFQFRTFECEEMVSHSIDMVVNADQPVDYSVVFFITANSPGLPYHKLTLRIGTPLYYSEIWSRQNFVMASDCKSKHYIVI